MSAQTSIEWTDATWNPVRGCSLVSEGCRNCYAMGVAARFSGPGQPYEGLARRRSNGKAQWTGEVRVIEKHMEDPLRWRRPRRIFVNSMSDLFHEKVSDQTIDLVVTVMACALAWERGHVFQVLTKRPDRMLAYFSDPTLRERIGRAVGGRTDSENADACTDYIWFGKSWPLPNVWLGASVEHQAAADERIPLLLQTPAAVRFLSCEPLLGHVDLEAFAPFKAHLGAVAVDCEHGYDACPVCDRGIDWVIAGGESGRNARPMHPHWAVDLLAQCESAGVPFFFKQHGEYRPVTPVYWDRDDRALDGADDHLVSVVDLYGREWINNEQRCDGQPPPGSWFVERVGKKRAGRELLGHTYDGFPAAVSA